MDLTAPRLWLPGSLSGEPLRYEDVSEGPAVPDDEPPLARLVAGAGFGCNEGEVSGIQQLAQSCLGIRAARPFLVAFRELRFRRVYIGDENPLALVQEGIAVENAVIVADAAKIKGAALGRAQTRLVERLPNR